MLHQVAKSNLGLLVKPSEPVATQVPRESEVIAQGAQRLGRPRHGLRVSDIHLVDEMKTRAFFSDNKKVASQKCMSKSTISVATSSTSNVPG